MQKINELYENRSKNYKKLNHRQKQTMNFLSILRLLIFVAGIGFSIYFGVMNLYTVSIITLVLTIILFIVLVHKHTKVKYKFNLTSVLSNINEKSVKRVNGEWKQFEDKGEEFIDDKHEYSYDLDIFGKNSLFQWINSTVTYLGRVTLKDMLTTIPSNTKEIMNKQEAINELSTKLKFRQKLNAFGILGIDKTKHEQELFEWSKETDNSILDKRLDLIANILTICTITILISSLILHKVSYNYLIVWIFVITILLVVFNNKIGNELDSLYKYHKTIKSYKNMLELIETTKFKSEYLNQIKQNMSDEEGSRAYEAIEELDKIASMIYDRKNMGYMIMDVVLLWDFRCIVKLQLWKKRYKDRLIEWLSELGKFEALSSLAVIRFDNPDWVNANFSKEDLMLQGKNIGHPLLTQERVCNDIKINNQKSILLITGSNMSGKSTYLRTSGINLVLAYSGAPVCAESFECSLMNIYSCMRVNDDLEKRISSFYAEILRIKTLVSAVERGEKVFFLLDEIFKGTNSIDRHTGAEILINKLSHEKACGMVSTHDFELCDLENKNHKIKNYNFREFYKDDKIYFDYKLREGISQTRNAMYLMKMAGISES